MVFILSEIKIILLILYDLCGECSLRNNVVAYEDISLHRRNAMANRSKEVNLEEESVARDNLLAELHIVDTHKIC